LQNLFQPKNSNAIELAIRNIFANPETYQLKADAGRTHIIENFDWQKIAKSYEDLIYKTIDEFQC
jgi:glycosyltransferase involved in cell wall biosynthesis